MKKTLQVLALGLGVRLALYYGLPGLSQVLDSRVEITTPVTSFKRLQEGLFLYHHEGSSPYSGSVFHQSPLLLAVFSQIEPRYVSAVYAVADTLTALVLARVAQQLGPQAFSPETVAAVYMFNPFTLLSSLAKSTGVFTQLALALALLSGLRRRSVQCMFNLALATSLSLFPLHQFASLVLLFGPGISVSLVVRLLATFVIWFSALTLVSLAIADGSWSFVPATLGAQYGLTDLTPTIGLWWYFFVEMFDYFRPFFTGLFQIYLGSYAIPLALRFRHVPVFAFACMVGLTTLFKSYPETGDLGFYLSLLMLHAPMFKLLNYPLAVVLGMLYCSALAPTFYHLWVYLGSGNSNFFYAITLVHGVSMIVLLADTMWSVLRLQYDGGKNASLSQI